jgi:hypothetical protein
MSNPLLNSQPKQNNCTNKLSQIISMVKMAKNPQAIIQNNPQLKSLLSLYNGDAKTAFYSLCKQKGIDPESILSQLK